MDNKQYLEAVKHTIDVASMYAPHLSFRSVLEETNRRLAALKAQEDNIKSEMW